MSLNLDKIFLSSLKILPCYDAFFGNLIFAMIIAQMLCRNHLNHLELYNLPTLWINSDPTGAVQIFCNQCSSERAIKICNFNSLKDEISEVNRLTFPFNCQSINFSKVVSYNNLNKRIKRVMS